MPINPNEFYSWDLNSQTQLQSTVENLDEFYNWGALAPEAQDDRFEVTKGILSGIDQLQAIGFGIGALIGDVVGSESMVAWGLGGYKSNMEEAKLNAAKIQSYEDIESFEDAVAYAMHGVGSALPMFVPSLVSGGIGAIAARKAAEHGIKIYLKSQVAKQVAKGIAEKEAIKIAARNAGAMAGAAVGSIGLETGSIFGDIYEQTGELRAGTAISFGTVAGMLDALPIGKVLNKFGVGKEAKEAITKQIQKGATSFIGKQILREAGTEGLQTIIERSAIKWVDDNKEVFGKEGWSEIVNAMIIGGLAGGVISVPAAILDSTRKQGPEPLDLKGAPEDISLKDVPSEFQGSDALNTELQESDALNERILGDREPAYGDALSEAIEAPVATRTEEQRAAVKLGVDELNAEQIRVQGANNLELLQDSDPSAQQELTSAFEAINADGALTQMATELQRSGMSDPEILKDLYLDALNTPEMERTPAQNYLLDVGDEARVNAIPPVSAEVAAQEKQIPPVSAEVAAQEEQIPTLTEEVVELEPEADETVVTPEVKKAVTEIALDLVPDAATMEDAGIDSKEKIAGISDQFSLAVEAKLGKDIALTEAEEVLLNQEAAKLFEAATKEPEITQKIEEAAAEAQLSPENDMPTPSLEQLEAGEYRKGHVEIQELPIAIENPKGSVRKGKGPDGKEWSVKMKDHYGYIEFTEGADGGPIDVFIGDNPESDKVFIVDQVNPATEVFDEHKVIMGALNERQAKMFYNRNYAKGWKGLGAITEMPMDEFKAWTKQPQKEALSPDLKAPAVTLKAKLIIEEALTDSDLKLIGDKLPKSSGAQSKYLAEMGYTYIEASRIKNKIKQLKGERGGGFQAKDGGAAENLYDARLKERGIQPVKQKPVKAVTPKAKPVKRTATKIKEEVEKPAPKPVPIGLDVEPTGPTPVPVKSDLEKVTAKGIHKTLAHIAQTTDNQAYKAIIEKILPHIADNVELKTVTIGEHMPEFYAEALKNSRAVITRSSKTGMTDIFIKDESFIDNGMSEETIIHESVHAATLELIATGSLQENANTPVGAAVRDLQKLQNVVMKYVNDRISAKKATDFEKDVITKFIVGDVAEIVAWGLTNSEFQAFLKSVPYSPKQTMWSKFTQSLAKLLGLNTSEHNALVELLENTNSLLDADFRQEIKLREKMMRIDTKSSSFQKAKDVLPHQFKIAQLRTERAHLAFQRDNRLDIKAGKRLKAIDAEIEILHQKIINKRKKDPFFSPKFDDDLAAREDRIIAKAKPFMTLRERISDWVEEHAISKDSFSRLYGWTINDLNPIAKLETGDTGKLKSAEESATKLSYASRNSMVQASVITKQYGLKLVGTQFVVDFDQLGLEKVLEPIGKLGKKYLRRFEFFMVVQRAERLAKISKENMVMDDDIQTMKDYMEAHPNLKMLFNGVYSEYQKLNRHVLQMAIDSGWMNEQDAFGGFRLVKGGGKSAVYKYQSDGSMFVDLEAAQAAAPDGYSVESVDGWYHEDYVPFNRIDTLKNKTKGLSAAGKIGQVRKGVIGLKGGIGKIPVLENIVKNIAFIVSGSMRTIAMQKTVELALDVAVEKIQVDGVAPLIDPVSARRALEKVGIPTEGLSDAELQRWRRMQNAVMPAAADSVVVYKNGRPHYYRVLDGDLLRAIKKIGPAQVKTWLKVIGFPTKVLTKAVTIMPPFLARNFVRETQNAYVINEALGLNPAKTLANAIKNFGKLLKRDSPEMLAMMASGYVNYNSYYNAAPNNVISRLLQMGVDKSAARRVVEMPWTGAKVLWDLYMRIAVASEYANRLSVMDAYVAKGYSKAEAMYQALDVLNFARRGDGMVMEIMIATIPFLNPRLQGADRMVRGFKSNWKAMAMKTGLMAAGSIALAVWNWDNNEEEMDKLKEEDKDLWFHFWIGGEHYRSPKGFEIGQIAGTLMERIVEQIKTDSPEPVWDSFKRFMMLTFGLQHPQFYRPALEIAQNEDFFRQRPIVSLGQQFASPKEQHNAWTNRLIIDIAQSMPDSAPDWAKSPVKLQYLLKAYTGSLGIFALEGANDLYHMTGNAPDAPTKALAQRYFVRDYYRSGVETSSRHINRLYSMLEDVGRLAVDLKAAKDYNMDKYRAKRIESADKIKVRKRLNRISTKMSRYTKQIRKLISHPTMTSDMKFIKIQVLQKKKNALAKEATDKYWWIFE